MSFFSHAFNIICAFFMSIIMGIGSVGAFTPAELSYESALGNPLKGFVPFFSENGTDNGVAHSAEFFYIPLSALISDSGDYTIKEGLEPYLSKIAARSKQAIFRVYLDYPASELGEKAVPQYIWETGIKKYTYTEFGGGVSPDFSDERLIDILVEFIHRLGDEYDGDKRIAYITAGLIGHWGEWHCYACPEAMATDDGQRKISDAYSESFSKTEILMRYPGTPGTESGNFGFHDDSFTYETLGDKSQGWFYYNRLKKAKQTDIWKTRPVGGEFRPEGQTDFLNGIKTDGYRDFDECLKKTHCSWLMMAGAFADGLSDKQKSAANTASAKLGYDFTVTKARVRRIFGKTEIVVAVKNTGSAPLYADTEIYIRSGTTEQKADGKPLRTLLPNETFFYKTTLAPESGDEISVRISSDDTLVPIRFSNVGGSGRQDGALILGSFK